MREGNSIEKALLTLAAVPKPRRQRGYELSNLNLR